MDVQQSSEFELIKSWNIAVLFTPSTDCVSLQSRVCERNIFNAAKKKIYKCIQRDRERWTDRWKDGHTLKER